MVTVLGIGHSNGDRVRLLGIRNLIMVNVGYLYANGDRVRQKTFQL